MAQRFDTGVDVVYVFNEGVETRFATAAKPRTRKKFPQLFLLARVEGKLSYPIFIQPNRSLHHHYYYNGYAVFSHTI